MIKIPQYKALIILALTMLAFSSCIDEEEYPNTPQGNFEARGI